MAIDLSGLSVGIVRDRDDEATDGCQHPNIPTVEFDQEAAKGLEYHEIRALWPRFCGKCPDCGGTVTAYASTAHYIYGDW